MVALATIIKVRDNNCAKLYWLKLFVSIFYYTLAITEDNYKNITALQQVNQIIIQVTNLLKIDSKIDKK